MSESVAHRHEWIVLRRVDFCHFIEIQRRCDCGAFSAIPEARDFANDPLAPAFADRDCDTCVARVRQAGVEPDEWRRVNA